jgi:hypothetical protein
MQMNLNDLLKKAWHIVVMISPILFVNGLVEIYMSSLWTLAYRDLKATELVTPLPPSKIQEFPS